MSVEIIKREVKVVFQRKNEAVQIVMHCGWMHSAFSGLILRKGDSLFFDNQEIKGNLYDLLNAAVENYFKRKSNDTRELKLLNFEKPQDDLLDMVKNVYCKRAEFSLSVEYEVHLHKEDLFDCKDC